MTQSQLDQAVARATGESVNTIRNYGFSPLIIPQVAYGPDHGGSQIRVRDTRSSCNQAIPARQLRKAA